MKKSKTISLFRISFLLLLTSVFNTAVIVAIFSVYLLFTNKKETIVYLFICFLLYGFSFIYPNIISLLDSFSNPIADYFYERLNLFDSETASVIRLIVFNENDYSSSLFLGYGLSSYLFIRFIAKKNRIISFVFTILISILFGFQIKYFLFSIEILLSYTKMERNNQKGILLLFVIIIEPDFLDNYSILFYLFIQIISVIEIGISFKSALCIFESILFGSFNLTSIFLYGLFSSLRIVLYLLSVTTLLFPFLDGVLIAYAEVYSGFYEFTEILIKGDPGIFIYLLYYLLIHRFHLKHELIQISILLSVILCPISYPYASVSFIDIGQGDAILLNGQFKQNSILIDTGSSYNKNRLFKYLNSKGLNSLDYLIITHDDEDHNGNQEELLKEYQVNNIITEGNDIENACYSLEYIDLGEFDNDNDNSLVYVLNKNGFSFLFTGDISEEAERELLKHYYTQTDVLKVSHHGSETATSDYFVSKILPRFSIISTNGRYGHPSEETISTLNKYGSEILITKEDGDIEFIFILDFCIVTTNNEWFVII